MRMKESRALVRRTDQERGRGGHTTIGFGGPTHDWERERMSDTVSREREVAITQVGNILIVGSDYCVGFIHVLNNRFDSYWRCQKNT